MKQRPDWTKIGLYGAAALTAIILGVALSFLIYAPQTDGRAQAPALATSAGGGQAEIGGPFELIDEDGATRTEALLEGEVTFVYFGFTNCPSFCPLELGNLAAAKTLLEEDGLSPQIVFITVDPERDTPQVLKPFVDYFDPDILGLTGSTEQVDHAVRAYRSFYRRVADADEPDGYTIDHMTLVYLMGPDGRFMTTFEALTPPDVIARETLAAAQEL